jgi:multicomponent Na+:H+ antiporter subunit E
MLRCGALLGLAWAALTADFTPASLIFGFAAGTGAAALVGFRRASPPVPLRRVPKVLALGAFFAWELLLSNLRVAAAILGPRHRLRPGVVAVPLDVTSDAEITLLASLITLTPGTLTLDVSPDRRTLYVHLLAMDDAGAARRAIKDGFERRIRAVFA